MSPRPDYYRPHLSIGEQSLDRQDHNIGSLQKSTFVITYFCQIWHEIKRVPKSKCKEWIKWWGRTELMLSTWKSSKKKRLGVLLSNGYRLQAIWSSEWISDNWRLWQFNITIIFTAIIIILSNWVAMSDQITREFRKEIIFQFLLKNTRWTFNHICLPRDTYVASVSFAL